jgi:hypothetical protein
MTRRVKPLASDSLRDLGSHTRRTQRNRALTTVEQMG